MRTFRSRTGVLLTIAIAVIVIAALGVAFLSRGAVLATYGGQGSGKQGYPAGHFVAYFGGLPPAPQPTLTAAERERLKESLMTPKYFSREETEIAVGFKLHIPAYIPKELELASIDYYQTKVGERGGPWENTWAVIMYWRESYTVLGVPQTPYKTLGLQQIRHLGKDYHFKVAEEAVQPITVKGRPAIYIEGTWMEGKWRRDLERSIAWSDDEFAFQLWSNDLPLEELIKVAESMP
ncbi:MAG: DUF4367 domain-containing protein [Chloroflexi bacterium]|nr:DUF4367 domain-containing protein [Chloroflexota bacterium]